MNDAQIPHPQMKRYAYLFLIALVALTSCTKKSLDIDVKQDGCSIFNISGATYELINDPSCTGLPLSATATISFEYTGREECLEKIIIDPTTKFTDSLGREIQGMFFQPVFFKSDSTVSIDQVNRTATFQFVFTFPNAADAGAFNNAYIEFHCENLQGQASRNAIVNFYGECARPVTDDFPVQTVNVRGDEIRVRLWDNASEDGDIVSVFLNGVWVLQQFRLSNAGNTFTWPILEDQPNDMVLIANNQGSSGPNTVSITLNGTHTFSFDLDLTTGQVLRIL
jgi:hypothetical protein